MPVSRMPYENILAVYQIDTIGHKEFRDALIRLSL